ncbi:MAG: oligosaccharide flippase family protein, partial [Eubacteriales bacterium]|nr:oligosaccharide flippase family protein [Eubacteriales bacterium]
MKKRNRVGFLNILSTCLLYGISIITAPLFSRLLGTGGYGNVSNYNVWVSILSIVATLQTQATLANAMVEFPASEQDKYQSSVLSLSLVCFAVVAALVLLFLVPISNALNLPTFFILLVLFQSFGTYGVNFMNRKLTYEMKAGRNLLLSLVTTLATMGLSLVFVLALPQEQRYYGRITAIAAVYGILGISLCISIWAKGKTFYNREFWRFCIPLAIPYVFYNLADLLLGHSDVIMLRQMAGDSTSGIYSTAFQLGTVLYTIFTALNNTWVPFFYEDTKQGNADAVRSGAENYLE